MVTLQLWQHKNTTWNSAPFLPQMSFSCITAGHSQKGLLNKPRMSVETFPGGTAPDHHHFGTAPLSSKSNVLMDGAFISSKTLLLLCCQRGGLLPAPQREGEVFLHPLDRHERAYKVKAGWEAKVSCHHSRKERGERQKPRPSSLNRQKSLKCSNCPRRWVLGTVWEFRCTTMKHFQGVMDLWLSGDMAGTCLVCWNIIFLEIRAIRKST